MNRVSVRAFATLIIATNGLSTLTYLRLKLGDTDVRRISLHYNAGEVTTYKVNAGIPTWKNTDYLGPSAYILVSRVRRSADEILRVSSF